VRAGQVLKFLASALVFTLALWWSAHLALHLDESEPAGSGWEMGEGSGGPDEELGGDAGRSSGRGGWVDPPGPKVVIIDPGHGGMDGGTVGHGLVEKNVTLLIASALKESLHARGIAAVLTRDSDRLVSLRDRSAFANRRPSHLLVSVHVNAGPASVSGIETFYSDPKGVGPALALRKRLGVARDERVTDSRDSVLARHLQSAVCATTGARDRGVKNRPDLSVTRHTHCPAVLVECGFVTDPGEARKIKDASYRNRLAKGLADGIAAFLQAVEGDPMLGLEIDEAGAPEIEVAGPAPPTDPQPLDR
jgi:N-acetylmuramoyl-L-alanine amidase